MGAVKTNAERGMLLTRRRAQRVPKEKRVLRDVHLRIVRPMYEAMEAASKCNRAIESLGIEPELAKALGGDMHAFIIFCLGIGVEVIGRAEMERVAQEKKDEDLVVPAKPGDMAKIKSAFGVKKEDLDPPLRRFNPRKG